MMQPPDPVPPERDVPSSPDNDTPPVLPETQESIQLVFPVAPEVAPAMPTTPPAPTPRRRGPPTPEEILQSYGVRSPREFANHNEGQSEQDYLIDRIIPASSIVLLLGDSELGKSPLAYLMAISVAAGVNCLGGKVRPGRVLYFDLENGLQNIRDWLQNIPAGLGLAGPPSDNVRLWSAHEPAGWEVDEKSMSRIIFAWKPSLVIIDTLPSFLPKVEEDNKTVNELFKSWRSVIRATGCSILFICHPKKEGHDNKRPPLEEANLRDWFQWTRGPKSLVTGVDVRLGVDAPYGEPSMWKGGADGQEKVELVLRGMSKGRGEISTIYLSRSYNDDGVPMIYRALTGIDLLFDPLYIDALKKLGNTFATKDAKHALGKGDSGTAAFLDKCESSRLIIGTGRGQWRKTQEGGECGA